MYNNAMYQNNQLPAICLGMIVVVSTSFGQYIGMIMQGAAGQYSYVSLKSGGRVFETSPVLTWDTVFECNKIVTVWKTIEEWKKDGSPLV